MYATINHSTLHLISLIIQAALETRQEKLGTLKKARIVVETLKRLIRMMSELNIIPMKNYLETQTDLQEISQMTNGWIRYITQSPR